LRTFLPGLQFVAAGAFITDRQMAVNQAARAVETVLDTS
jgi:hypothetical protein